MKATRIHNARVLTPEGRFVPGSVRFDRSILGIDSTTTPAVDEASVDAGGARLTPGLSDIHLHGIGLHSFERGPDELRAALRMLPRFGVTTALPTLYRVLRREDVRLLNTLADALDTELAARAPGFHLEGPFLAIAGAGALTLNGDVGLLDDLIDACRGKVCAMSISPEVPGILPVIKRLVERRIVPFITHTRASAEQTDAAIAAGARHATHFYDVFPLPAETEPGVRPAGAIEAILADRRCSVDFICDGVHVHPAAIRAALAAKGPSGIVAISDANLGAGLPPGEFDTPWGYRVRTKPNDAARVADSGHALEGLLAGSSLTLNRAVQNLERWLPDSPAPWLAATANPARVLGLSDRGRITPGLSADLVLWNDDFTPRAVWIQGNRVDLSESAS